ncbi:MAG: class I SAM-dependent methyltransferase [Polyangiaceae bacterium]
MSGPEFDRHARTYDDDHRASIRASGEDPDYFAAYKRDVLVRLLGSSFTSPVLDFGCGIGNLLVHLHESFPDVHGYDPSSMSVARAKERVPSASLTSDLDALPKGKFGAIVVANVLHHVKPDERASLVARMTSLLAEGGRLVVFEHNPWNPLTRRAVATCKFDEDAILLWPWETKRLLRDAGLEGTSLDYIVFFPKFLAGLRPMEPNLAWLPIGAQVCAWGAKGGQRDVSSKQ